MDDSLLTKCAHNFLHNWCVNTVHRSKTSSEIRLAEHISTPRALLKIMTVKLNYLTWIRKRSAEKIHPDCHLAFHLDWHDVIFACSPVPRDCNRFCPDKNSSIHIAYCSFVIIEELNLLTWWLATAVMTKWWSIILLVGEMYCAVMKALNS